MESNLKRDQLLRQINDLNSAHEQAVKRHQEITDRILSFNPSPTKIISKSVNPAAHFLEHNKMKKQTLVTKQQKSQSTRLKIDREQEKIKNFKREIQEAQKREDELTSQMNKSGESKRTSQKLIKIDLDIEQ